MKLLKKQFLGRIRSLKSFASFHSRTKTPDRPRVVMLAEERQAEQNPKPKPYSTHAVPISDVAEQLLSCPERGSGMQSDRGSQASSTCGLSARRSSPRWNPAAARSGRSAMPGLYRMSRAQPTAESSADSHRTTSFTHEKRLCSCSRSNLKELREAIAFSAFPKVLLSVLI